jgi:hypothetical protein
MHLVVLYKCAALGIIKKNLKAVLGLRGQSPEIYNIFTSCLSKRFMPNLKQIGMEVTEMFFKIQLWTQCHYITGHKFGPTLIPETPILGI